MRKNICIINTFTTGVMYAWFCLALIKQRASKKFWQIKQMFNFHYAGDRSILNSVA